MPDTSASKLTYDLSTIRPVPRAEVLYKGKKYGVLSLIDLPYEEMVEILSTAAGEKRGTVESVDHTHRQLRMLVPDLEAKVLKRMTYREAVAFLESALGVAENPPTGGETTPDS